MEIIKSIEEGRDVTSLIKDRDMNINAVERRSSRSALHFAVLSKNFDTVSNFISTCAVEEREIDFELNDRDGSTPLHLACNSEQVKKSERGKKSGATEEERRENIG